MSYKLLTYASETGPRAAVLMDDGVFDAETLSGNSSYRTMVGILKDWDAADEFFSNVTASPQGIEPKPLSATRILAPIQYPGQIWAAGANYQDHISELDDSEFRTVNAKTISGGRPWFFSKPSHGAVVGHGTNNPLPHYSTMVDWEIELAVVIGRAAYRIPAEEAMEYVAGYTIANDLSARDYIAREGMDADSPFRFDWLAHKGFEASCPMGPFITPARFVKDPQNLNLKLWVNDELMQDSNTKFMIFSIAELIEEISARVTLHPGDVVLTGTPSGVGYARNVFLKHGDSLRLQIDDLGELLHGFE